MYIQANSNSREDTIMSILFIINYEMLVGQEGRFPCLFNLS